VVVVGVLFKETPLELEVQAAVEMVALVVLEVMELKTQGVVEVVEVLLAQVLQAATAALALSSLKYLTTYPQHSLVALHLAYPHLSLGSTSTL
jgi:hypothetical protein